MDFFKSSENYNEFNETYDIVKFKFIERSVYLYGF
jgi:hypothetical protein